MLTLDPPLVVSAEAEVVWMNGARSILARCKNAQAGHADRDAEVNHPLLLNQIGTVGVDCAAARVRATATTGHGRFI